LAQGLGTPKRGWPKEGSLPKGQAKAGAVELNGPRVLHHPSRSPCRP